MIILLLGELRNTPLVVLRAVELVLRADNEVCDKGAWAIFVDVGCQWAVGLMSAIISTRFFKRAPIVVKVERKDSSCPPTCPAIGVILLSPGIRSSRMKYYHPVTSEQTPTSFDIVLP